MRQAIVTKYHGPTDTRGSRVSATAQAKRIFVGWNDALDVEGNHLGAAMKLAKLMGWKGKWYGGGLPDGKGNAYVVADGEGIET